MAESEIHKRARNVLRPGDWVGQPIGDSFQIARTEQDAEYAGDHKTKGLRADLVVETTDSQTVYIEFEVTHPITADKLERLKEAGVHLVLAIKLLPECKGYSDDQLRDYIAHGNVFQRGQDLPKTHKWLHLPVASIFEKGPTSTDPYAMPAQWEKHTEELARHSCYAKGCDRPVTHAVESELREDETAGQTATRQRYPRFEPMLPIYACEDHYIEASLRQLPEGAEEGWHKPVEEYFARQPQDPKNNCKRIPCRIDRQFTCFAGPHYDASTLIGLPVAPGDCQ